MQTYPVKIRFNDLDGYNHVNNAVYLTYFEEARINFLGNRVGVDWNWDEAGMLLARVEIDYLLPVVLANEVQIHISVCRIGSKSFDLKYLIEKREGDVWIAVTKGKSVQVCYNFKSAESIAIPESWMKNLKEELAPGN